MELTRVSEPPPQGSLEPDELPSDPAELVRRIRRIVRSAGEPVDTCKQLLRTLMQLPGVAGAAYFRRHEDGQLRAFSPLLCRSMVSKLVPTWEPEIRQLVSRVVADGDAATISQGVFDIAACCVGQGSDTAGALCLITSREHLAPATVPFLLHSVADELAIWSQSPTSAAEEQIARQVIALATQVGFESDYSANMHRLAKTLEQELGVAQVFLGTSQGRQKHCRLQAISGLARFKRPSPLIARMEDLMAEAAVRSEPRTASREARLDATVAEQGVLDVCGAARIVSGPLRHQGRVLGAWVAVIANDQQDASAEAVAANLVGLEGLTAGKVALFQAARPGIVSRTVSRLLPHRRATVVGGLVAIACLLAVPWPYRIKCDCELQPVTRRFVPAPYDGVLNTVTVKPGDLVQEDQVLACMDRQEIHWQLAAHRADLMRASKEHDAAMASRDTSAAQLARLEMERLEVEITLLRNRAGNLEVKSPVSGVVISGDPQKLEGARLTMGQTLVEVGPLEEMLVEVLVDDRDVAYVEPGQSVRLRFDAYPHRVLSGSVQRVRPRAEPRDQQNVFVAEVILKNPDRLLRPGMMGRGRISTPPRPLGWNLFHRAAERLMRIMWW